MEWFGERPRTSAGARAIVGERSRGRQRIGTNLFLPILKSANRETDSSLNAQIGMSDWKPYDPAWLVEWARDNRPDLPWLPEALARCTRVREESRAYHHFADPDDPAVWRFESSIQLSHPTEGNLVLDVLEGPRIGGIEFLARL